jgi:hypothetical protein
MARIIVSGTMIREPRGGSTLWYLAWLVGFKMNGHEVYFVEKSEWPDDCYDIPNRKMTTDCSYGYNVVKRLLEKYDLHNNFCFVDYHGNYHGLNKPFVDELFRTADLYVDLEWAQWKDESVYCGMRVFVDGEPGWFQVRIKKWIESGMALPAYDHFFTDGNLIGTEHCDVPTCGIAWKHNLPPVLLQEIKNVRVNGGSAFTTVMNWNPNKRVAYNGKEYGHKDIEFEKIMSLPSKVDEQMEVAVSGKKIPWEELKENGWLAKKGDDISITASSYLDYIGGSKGEFSVAKQAFVTTQCGWFNDRSGYYMGFGKPVVLQETGYSKILPTGHGLIPFTNIDEAAEAIRNVSSNYAVHSKAARELAFEYMEAGKVTRRFLDKIGM